MPRRIARPLSEWYRHNKRSLPWRETSDPYAIWISEVMLQQTRVDTVIPYFERFLARFPNTHALASADTDDVLEHWAGLGYYSRGRNLQRAAQAMVRDHDGFVPEQLTELESLPGIGKYTAAAVGSIAFDVDAAVVDGNVERVLCRYLALDADPKKGAGKKRVAEAADLALDRRQPGDHNQAMMELGATVCLPRNPECGRCPLARHCAAHHSGNMESYPPPRARRAPELQRWVAAIGRRGADYVLMKTPDEQELLSGHWGVPLGRLRGRSMPREATLVRSAAKLAEQFYGRSESPRVHTAIRHSITYRKLEVHGVSVEIRGRLPRTLRRVSRQELGRLPALYRKLLQGAD